MTTTPNPLDPKSILDQAFDMGDEFPGPAEDLLLSWLLSLGADQEPAAAAKVLLPRYAEALAGKGDTPITKLLRLLEQVAVSPPAAARRGRLSGRTKRPG